jgi:hypothetical protein
MNTETTNIQLKKAQDTDVIDYGPFFNENWDKLDEQIGILSSFSRNVKDTKYGAKGDGTTSDSTAIQNAINDAHNNGGGIVFCPPGTYKQNLGLTLYTNVLLMGVPYATIFDFSGLTTPASAITINGGVDAVTEVMNGIWLKGNVTLTTGTYTANLTALEIGAYQITFRNVSITGFDKPTKFDSNSYIVTFDNCGIRYCNYAFYYDQTGIANSGEKIVFKDGILANCVHGIYNYLGNLKFVNTSIDYHLNEHIARNTTKINGTSSGAMYLIDCHLENAVANSPTARRIISDGTLYLDNCTLWDDISIYGTLNEWAIFDNCHFHGQSTQYYFDGSTPPIIQGDTQVNASSSLMYNPKLSHVLNGDFETGDATGWTATEGTISADNTKHNNGLYSLKMTGGQYTGCTANSKKIPLGNYTKYNFSLFVDTYLNTGACYPYITFYDLDNISLGSTQLAIAKNASDSFVYAASGWQQIPVNSAYAIITLKTSNAGATVISYFDDVYLSLA